MGAEASKTKTELDPTDIVLNLNGRFGYQQLVVHTSRVLGTGAYGNVVKATLDEVPCAAKILHRAILDSGDPGVNEFVTRFEQEIQILRDLKHACIVQFLCVVQDPTTRKPILLMELMKESLTHFLENSATDIPYHVQVNIAHDISLAIAHLHRNGVLHRDLSSNNVLLNDIHMAKVTDFGMSKIADNDPSMTRSQVTKCPGTLVYMPPEALRPQPRYSDKIDSFSIGVLLVQIVTRNFPSPTAASITKEDPNSLWGEIDVPIPEVERRKSDIEKIPPSHGFLSIVCHCLKDRSKERPTAAQLCQSLGELKTSPEYKEAFDKSNVYEGRTELHGAAEKGDARSVQRLLVTVNINSRTKDDGLTALHLASRNGHVAVVCLLVQAHAVINLKSKDDWTPLIYASREGHVAVVNELLQHNADVSFCRENGCSPLYIASEYGHTEVVDILLNGGADINQAAKGGFSPLFVASQCGHTEVVDVLLNAGADVHHATTKDGDVPLGIAAQEGHLHVVRKLLQGGANVNHQNKQGATPLFFATRYGHSEVVKLLLQARARDIPNEFGGTALSEARSKGHTQIVYLLQQQK